MNLVDYISELLVQRNEIGVPGLGNFTRERVSAYYNDKEARFYPPYYRVSFEAQTTDDDFFTQYIADQKNISSASSKYFTEKFVIKLKDDAAKGAFLFNGIGSFQMEQDQLVFKPNDKVADDPTFYGYPVVNIHKTDSVSHTGHVKPVFVQAASSPVITAAAVSTAEPEQYFEDAPEVKRRTSIWFILGIIVAVLALGLFGVYTFYPGLPDNITGDNHQTILKKTKVVPVPKPDTQKAVVVDTTTAKVDTATAPVSGAAVKPIDSVKTSGWKIILESHETAQKAADRLSHYQELGITATVLPDEKGKHFFVSVGPFATRDEEETERNKLVKAHKIAKDSYPLEIKPQK